MNISAIVPVWNGRDLLARLLATLDLQSRPAAELLIVDNGSTDGAAELARARGARVIAMGRNAGFAAAVNRGIREAGHPLVAILNSDVELAPDYLVALANEYGTPLYVYHAETIRRQYDKLATAFRNSNTLFFYACKALTNIKILKYI